MPAPGDQVNVRALQIIDTHKVSVALRGIKTHKTSRAARAGHTPAHAFTQHARSGFESDFTCLYVLGVKVQGVADFGDVHRSVLGHALLLLGHVHKRFGWFLLIIGPDLRKKAEHTHTHSERCFNAVQRPECTSP